MIYLYFYENNFQDKSIDIYDFHIFKLNNLKTIHRL
jgi:hypothetical protein